MIELGSEAKILVPVNTEVTVAMRTKRPEDLHRYPHGIRCGEDALMLLFQADVVGI